MKKWIIITKDDEQDVLNWQVAGNAGLIIKPGDGNLSLADSQENLIPAINDEAVSVVVINRKKRASTPDPKIIFNPDSIEAIWIHFGDVNWDDMNTKEKVRQRWATTCTELSFTIATPASEELQVFPMSGNRLPWGNDCNGFKTSGFNTTHLEAARTKAQQHYGIHAPAEKTVNAFLPFYLEVLCRLEETKATGTPEPSIEILRQSWEVARQQWVETLSPVTKVFLAIAPEFNSERLTSFCEAYKECSHDYTKQLLP